jgi:8-oxo-dGTP pyrophosphatase MutT (NUDIX family)
MSNVRLPKIIGKITYIITFFGIRYMLRGSVRAYVLITVDDTAILTKNWLGLHKKWRLPGGGIHQKEDPTMGAIREVYEELGITLTKNQLVLIGGPFTSKKHFSYWLYKVELTTMPTIAMNQQELVEAQWIPVKNIPQHATSEEVKQAIAG